jgi:hypothetical protein
MLLRQVMLFFKLVKYTNAFGKAINISYHIIISIIGLDGLSYKCRLFVIDHGSDLPHLEASAIGRAHYQVTLAISAACRREFHEVCMYACVAWLID